MARAMTPAAYPRVDCTERFRAQHILVTLAGSEQRAGPALPSYLALHHAGFSVPSRSLETRWALTPPFHPYHARRPRE